MTRRQFLSLFVVAALGSVLVAAVALGWQSLAIALVGVLVVVTFASVFQLRRRLGEVQRGTQQIKEEVRRLHREVGAVGEGVQRGAEALYSRGEFAQRRIVGAVENEPLKAAERQQALLSLLRDLSKEGSTGAGETTPSPETSQELDLQDNVLKEQDQFRQRHGYPLNLASPRSFTEKLCWRKLFDRNPLFPIVADKYRVREFVGVMLGPEDAERYLVPLLFQTPDPEAIPFDQLPSEYVIKMNHGMRMNLIIREGSNVSHAEIINQCREWKNIDVSLRLNQWAYSEIDRRIIGEALILGEEGRPPREFMLHMFDGECRLVQVRTNDEWYDGHTKDSGRLVTQTFYTPDWKEVKLMHGLISAPEEEPPDELEELMDLARRLSSPFDFMRVDCYLASEGIRFGELEMYPRAGVGRFATAALDFEIGRLWRLPHLDSARMDGGTPSR